MTREAAHSARLNWGRVPGRPHAAEDVMVDRNLLREFFISEDELDTTFNSLLAAEELSAIEEMYDETSQ